jgi:hypothetical protein
MRLPYSGLSSYRRVLLLPGAAELGERIQGGCLGRAKVIEPPSGLAHVAVRSAELRIGCAPDCRLQAANMITAAAAHAAAVILAARAVMVMPSLPSCDTGQPCGSSPAPGEEPPPGLGR